MKYAAMASQLTSPDLLLPLGRKDRDAAMRAANAFRCVEDFLEHNAPCGVGLDVLIEAEETYARLTGDVP